MSTVVKLYRSRSGAWMRIYVLMMTSSNGTIFHVTGPLCGEFTGPGEFPAQRPVTRSFDVFFDLRVNKRLSKQPRGWRLETPSWSLWRHRNVWKMNDMITYQSGRSPKVVALISATNFSSYIIELLQLHDTIQIKWNYAWVHNNTAIRSHLMI